MLIVSFEDNGLGLNGMFAAYKKQFPTVEIVNATVAGGAGTNAKAVMTTRLFGGDPPDSFLVHAGLEVATYTPVKYLQPLVFKQRARVRATLLDFENRIRIGYLIFDPERETVFTKGESVQMAVQI